jgi:cytidine deaminase
MTDGELISAALGARSGAYAPYSKFRVGAALLTEGDQVFLGGNIENISFGLTMCAERVAVGCAVHSGATKLLRLAIAADSAEPIVPCGACRQVLAEFNPNLPIVSSTLAGAAKLFDLGTLLPLCRQGILESFHVEHVPST